MNRRRSASLALASIGLVIPLVTQGYFALVVCHYVSLLPLVVLMLVLSVPAAVCIARGAHVASLLASLSAAGWIAWVNYVQCISEDGPFVGGLGALYLVTLSLFSGAFIAVFGGWVERRLKRSR